MNFRMVSCSIVLSRRYYAAGWKPAERKNQKGGVYIWLTEEAEEGEGVAGDAQKAATVDG